MGEKTDGPDHEHAREEVNKIVASLHERGYQPFLAVNDVTVDDVTASGPDHDAPTA